MSVHVNPGEIVAILGSKNLRNEMLLTLAGRQYGEDVGQIMLQGLDKTKKERMHFVSYFDTSEHLIDTQTVNRSLMISAKMQANSAVYSQMIVDDLLASF